MINKSRKCVKAYDLFILFEEWPLYTVVMVTGADLALKRLQGCCFFYLETLGHTPL